MHVCLPASAYFRCKICGLFNLYSGRKCATLDHHMAINNAYVFTRKPNNPFYEKLGMILWIPKHNDFPPLWFSKPVRQLVYHKVLPIMKVRLHRSSSYKKGLDNEISDRNNDHYS